MVEHSDTQFQLNSDLSGLESLLDETGLEAVEGLESTPISTELDASLLEQVEVTSESVKGRQRRIVAQIQIPRPIQQVWEILTDYDRLDEFIPNLSKSRRVPNAEGITLIEQVGAQCWLNIRFCARVVLQMDEAFPQEIRFRMVEGDFKGFEGTWQLTPVELDGKPGTALTYSVMVLPKLTMPIALIERHLRRNLAVNLVAIQQRAIALFAV